MTPTPIPTQPMPSSVSDVRRVSQRRRGWVIAALVLVLSAVVLTQLWPRGRVGSPEASAYERLVAASSTFRVSEGRLTGGFAYVPEPPADTPPPPPHGLLQAATELQRAAGEEPTLANLHARGVAALALREYDVAIGALEEAAARQPDAAPLSSDLSVAYFTRAARTGRVDDIPKALAAAERALRSDARLREAAFNRALALEHLTLAAAAERAYESYLQMDLTGSWADHARARVRVLRARQPPAWAPERDRLLAALDRDDRDIVTRIVQAFPQASRELLEDDLLPSWGRAAQRASAGATDVDPIALTRATRLADAVSAGRGDPFFAEVMRELPRLPAAARRLAAAAFVRFSDGRHLQQLQRSGDAMQPFEEAATLLRRAGSRFALRADVEVGYGRYFHGRLEDAATMLDRVGAEARRRTYWTIDARAQVTRGVVAFAQADFARAVENQRKALDLYTRCGERENVASVHHALAEPLRAMGERRTANTHVHAALSLLPIIRDDRRRHLLLVSGALGALRDDLPEVAVALLDEDLAAPASERSPVAIGEALLHRGRAWHRLGDEGRAAEDLAEAARWTARIPDESLRRRIEAELSAAQGEVLLASRPEEAIAQITRSQERYADIGSRFRAARLYLARGRAQLALSRRDAALADFTRGIDAMEAQQASIADERFRISHFDETWDLYGEVIRLHAEAGRVEDAFDAAERSRARSLSRAFATPDVASRSLATIRESLPADVGLVTYALVRARLHLWVIRREAVLFRTRDVNPSELTAAVRAMTSVDEAGFRRAARELYDVLIASAEAEIARCRRLVFVPDGILYRVPFAALTNPATGEALIDRREIAIAHSVRLLTGSPGATPRPLPAGAQALIVANPAPGRSGLPALPFAEREAQAVRAAYPRSTVLSGKHATREQFLADVPRADVLHFAGHAIASEEFPWLSRLMFAGAAGEDDAMFVHELPRTRIGRMQLVVLAACQTGVGATPRGEGVLNLARPFLLAGVPFVVVSAWDIDDDTAAAVFSAFHRRYVATHDPVRALADTQRELRRSADARVRHPHAWAGYTVVSGVGRSLVDGFRREAFE